MLRFQDAAGAATRERKGRRSPSFLKKRSKKLLILGFVCEGAGDEILWVGKPGRVSCVGNNMSHSRKTFLLGAFLVGFGAAVAKLSSPAHGSDFTAFAEDEDVCRQAGTKAIQGASGPEAAQRYDVAHGQCMVAHGRMRMIDAYRNATLREAYPFGNPDSFDYPDAFYGIPYATPGYGYDGFSR